MYHYTYKNIADHFNQTNEFTTLAAQSMVNNHGKFAYLALLYKPFFKFFQSYFLRRGFLDGFAGFIIALMASIYVFVKYFKLWELQKSQNIKK